jgi:hypothetical protein
LATTSSPNDAAELRGVTPGNKQVPWSSIPL